MHGTDLTPEQVATEERKYDTRLKAAKTPEERGKIVDSWGGTQADFLNLHTGKGFTQVEIGRRKGGWGTRTGNEIGVVELLSRTGEPSISLRDGSGMPRVTVGQADLQVVRTGTIEKLAASSLVLVDKEGKVMWKVP